MPADSSAPPAAAPAIPPRLNIPCSADMIGLPSAISTALASAFIATSSVAIEKPNSASTATSIQYSGTTRISAAQADITSPPVRHAVREPTRAIQRAIVSIAAIEPPATANNATDSSPALSSNLSRTVGTCTPHDAYIMPATKKSAIVAVRARRRTGNASARCASGGAAKSDGDRDEDSDTGRSRVGRWMGAGRRLDSSDFIEALTILPAVWALWALWVLQTFGGCRASEMPSAVSACRLCLAGVPARTSSAVRPMVGRRPPRVTSMQQAAGARHIDIARR
ncbi:hypothetical protein BVI434_1580017 [Burkholderia vietnamiensis]|nr:hypothetical protein BVI434_1580017 [Burkholderia vietnamiensis]